MDDASEELTIRATFVYALAMHFIRLTFQDAKTKLQEEGIEPWGKAQDWQLLKEAAKLVAFILTREVWERAVADEQDAKEVNRLLMDFFERDLQLSAAHLAPYAEASESNAWVSLFGSRVVRMYGREDAILALEINQLFLKYFPKLILAIKNSFYVPIEHVTRALAEINSDE